jgi:hypothetical protein
VATSGNLIAATTTTTGLKVHAELNTEAYQSGIKVSDDELGMVKIRSDKFLDRSCARVRKPLYGNVSAH